MILLNELYKKYLLGRGNALCRLLPLNVMKRPENGSQGVFKWVFNYLRLKMLNNLVARLASFLDWFGTL